MRNLNENFKRFSEYKPSYRQLLKEESIEDLKNQLKQIKDEKSAFSKRRPKDISPLDWFETEEAEDILKREDEIESKIYNIKYSEELANAKEEVKKINKSEVRSKVFANGYDLSTEQMYPREIYPFLYQTFNYGDTWRFYYKLYFDLSEVVHTVFRGINSKEMDYVNETGYIKSNQSYNIGYEVDQGLTVYATNFRSALNYANDFAPKQFRPTEETPNYILMVEPKEENGFKFDPNDDYIKTPNAIPKSQIVGIFEVYPNNKINKIK